MFFTAWGAYSDLGREEEAFEAFLRGLTYFEGEGPSPDSLRAVFRREGHEAAIQAYLDGSTPEPGEWFGRAGMELFVGETDAALASAERAVDEREHYAPWVLTLGLGPDGAVLRENPRFHALVRRIGLEVP